ncbi:MAG: HEAT repeat domain-containing protein [Elusimicrobiales bacterium]|nr:HEAT repeat domain-containing protein [Elusimicrobiales bacterium]
MNVTLKNLTLTTVLLAFSASAYASGAFAENSGQYWETSLLMNQAMDEGAAPETRDVAVNTLLSNIESYQASIGNKGPYEDNLKARIKAIDSIWSLGEIGDPKLMSKLSKFYSEADDVIKMNLLISMGKLKRNTKAGPYLFTIATDPRETEVVRSVAFEMLEHIGYPSTVVNITRSEPGIAKADLIYTGGITGTISGWFSPDLPIGHAGLFVGTEVKNGKISVIIADCVPDNFKPGGVRNIYSWNNFTHHFMYPYYGNRTTPVKPTPAQRDQLAALALSMGTRGLTYSDTHMSQKGPLKFDCVGYTEFLYESVGINPTEDSYETGTGWPLTPWEQFISVKPQTRPASAIIIPQPQVTAPSQGIITSVFGSLTNHFGSKAVEIPEVGTDIAPQQAD